MAAMVNLGGMFVNPLNIEAVEEAEEVQETKREGMVTSSTKVKVINISMKSGAIRTIEASSQDPAIQQQLLHSVIHDINIGLNADMNSIAG